MESDVQNIQHQFARPGRVEWIGLRPAKGEAMRVVETADLSILDGVRGDRFSGKPGARRQVTLIQKEHLDVVAGLLQTETVDPGRVRRNVVVSGINLVALKNARFSVGQVELEGTGACPPCSNMEANLGRGGFNAMRGHGGITARVIRGGTVRTGDEVRFVHSTD